MLWIGVGLLIGLALARGRRQENPSGPQQRSIPSGEAQTTSLHLRARPDVQALWTSGLNLMIEGLGNLMGRICVRSRKS